MSAKGYFTKALFSIFTLCFVSAADAQVRTGASRHSATIGRAVDVFLGHGASSSMIPPRIRHCPPTTNVHQPIYYIPEVSYLGSSTPAYSYAPPTYVQNTTNVYRGYDRVATGSGLAPAREWGNQTQSFVAMRQIAGYGGSSKAGPAEMAYSSRHPSTVSQDKKSSRIQSSEMLNAARMIGVAMGRGEKAFERGLYDEARAEYAKALILSEEDAGAKLSMGVAAFAQGEFIDAAEAIHEGILSAPPLLIAKYNICTLYGKKEECKEHMARLEQYSSTHQDDAEILLLLGFMHHGVGDDKKALDVLRNPALTSSPAAIELIRIIEKPASTHPTR